MKELDGHRVLTPVYRTSNDKHWQHSCCMTHDSFNQYLTDRDPNSKVSIWALINLCQTVTDSSILCDNFGDDVIDWRVDKQCKDFIRIDINKEILYSPDENSEETMRSLQIKSLMADLPSFLRKTLPHEESCMSKEVCLFESMLTFASKFEDFSS